MVLTLMLQVVLKFKYNFWEKVVQGADFFGHVPRTRLGRGHCGLFYDLCSKVTDDIAVFIRVLNSFLSRR